MQNKLDLHHIQRAIILSLATLSPQRFSQLQPPRIPNNTFSYHLKQLLQNGYIDQQDDGYVLTRKALKSIALVQQEAKKMHAPALLTIVYVTNDEGEVLLVNRNKKPFQGWYGLPGGHIHAGENPTEAATREVFEKVGLKTETTPTMVGWLDFQYREKETNDLFVHAYAVVFTYHVSGDASALTDNQTIYGQASWSLLGRQHILPEVHVVKEMVADATDGSLQHRSVVFSEPKQTPILDLT